MQNFKAVFFDFDGTLARTMEDNFAAWKAVLKEYNVDLKPDGYFPLEGINLEQLVSLLTQNKIFNINPIEILNKKEKYYLEHNNFSFYPGVERLIILLKLKQVLMGIVTTGGLDRISRVASSTFFNQFNVVITGEKFKEKRQGYSKAAKLLGMDSSECIVVENSPVGIKEAKAAGMYCIGITSTLDRSYLKDANKVVNSFSELKDLDIFRRLLK